MGTVLTKRSANNQMILFQNDNSSRSSTPINYNDGDEAAATCNHMTSGESIGSSQSISPNSYECTIMAPKSSTSANSSGNMSAESTRRNSGQSRLSGENGAGGGTIHFNSDSDSDDDGYNCEIEDDEGEFPMSACTTSDESVRSRCEDIGGEVSPSEIALHRQNEMSRQAKTTTTGEQQRNSTRIIGGYNRLLSEAEDNSDSEEDEDVYDGSFVSSRISDFSDEESLCNLNLLSTNNEQQQQQQSLSNNHHPIRGSSQQQQQQPSSLTHEQIMRQVAEGVRRQRLAIFLADRSCSESTTSTRLSSSVYSRADTPALGPYDYDLYYDSDATTLNTHMSHQNGRHDSLDEIGTENETDTDRTESMPSVRSGGSFIASVADYCPTTVGSATTTYNNTIATTTKQHRGSKQAAYLMLDSRPSDVAINVEREKGLEPRVTRSASLTKRATTASTKKNEKTTKKTRKRETRKKETTTGGKRAKKQVVTGGQIIEAQKLSLDINQGVNNKSVVTATSLIEPSMNKVKRRQKRESAIKTTKRTYNRKKRIQPMEEAAAIRASDVGTSVEQQVEAIRSLPVALAPAPASATVQSVQSSKADSAANLTAVGPSGKSGRAIRSSRLQTAIKSSKGTTTTATTTNGTALWQGSIKSLSQLARNVKKSQRLVSQEVVAGMATTAAVTVNENETGGEFLGGTSVESIGDANINNNNKVPQQVDSDANSNSVISLLVANSNTKKRSKCLGCSVSAEARAKKMATFPSSGAPQTTMAPAGVASSSLLVPPVESLLASRRLSRQQVRLQQENIKRQLEEQHRLELRRQQELYEERRQRQLQLERQQRPATLDRSNYQQVVTPIQVPAVRRDTQPRSAARAAAISISGTFRPIQTIK